MEQLYTLLKNSINEDMGWMIDHIYVRRSYVFIMGQTFMNRLEICLFMFSMFI